MTVAQKKPARLSPYFETIADSRDARNPDLIYTVFRAIVRFGASPESLNFCILWDEDQDNRIIDVAERLWLANMLTPVRFIREHQGHLDVYVHLSKDELPDFEKRLRKRKIHLAGGSDYWSVELHCVDSRGKIRGKRNPLAVPINGISETENIGRQSIALAKGICR